MTLPRFVQIHTLHSYPAALLNRDDSGLAKRLPFGGATRTRVSSQCLKRHWRVADDEFSLLNIDGSADVVRSRNVVERRVMEGLDDKTGASEDVVRVVEQAFQIGVYGDKGTLRAVASRSCSGCPRSNISGSGPVQFSRHIPWKLRRRARLPRQYSRKNATTSRLSGRMPQCPDDSLARCLAEW